MAECTRGGAVSGASWARCREQGGQCAAVGPASTAGKGGGWRWTPGVGVSKAHIFWGKGQCEVSKAHLHWGKAQCEGRWAGEREAATNLHGSSYAPHTIATVRYPVIACRVSSCKFKSFCLPTPHQARCVRSGIQNLACKMACKMVARHGPGRAGSGIAIPAVAQSNTLRWGSRWWRICILAKLSKFDRRVCPNSSHLFPLMKLPLLPCV
ncbi:unnamed protein product [Chondrus crispus]|uniref:Uncharacterized protein n=1 Tax=Chondrus crispus TaxID=2769 RepID=R7QHC3_CHOCR|nr:unnamed protein product [Chondrus crispus]CDF37153.1 unnamed protein product [Chondrus crispus]|eukprot:XP_005716972.1 unnamed protein product [Chondrus crispus]